jgi:hypothetical protein
MERPKETQTPRSDIRDRRREDEARPTLTRKGRATAVTAGSLDLELDD